MLERITKLQDSCCQTQTDSIRSQANLQIRLHLYSMLFACIRNHLNHILQLRSIRIYGSLHLDRILRLLDCLLSALQQSCLLLLLLIDYSFDICPNQIQNPQRDGSVSQILYQKQTKSLYSCQIACYSSYSVCQRVFLAQIVPQRCQ